MKHFGVTVCLAALFVLQQSLSIKEETQNRSLYLCEVLMSKNHICHNFNRGVGPYYRLGWREGRKPGVLWLCHDKICLISPPPPPKALKYSSDPPHLQSVLYSPPFILCYRRLIPPQLLLPKKILRTLPPPGLLPRISPASNKLLTGLSSSSPNT